MQDFDGVAIEDGADGAGEVGSKGNRGDSEQDRETHH